MKSPCFLLLVCLGAASAQAPAPPLASPRPPAAAAHPKAAPSLPDLPDPTVIAEFQDGTKFTMGDLKRLYPVLPAPLQNAVKQDPVEFFHEYATMLKYDQIAREKKLDEQSPFKEALYFSRLIYMYQAQLQDVFTTATVEPNEIVNYYGQHKDDFKEIKVKAIYIPFADVPSAEDKTLTEEQAKAKAEKLVAEIKGGADFVKLVRENSQDPDSKAKDGDFGTFGATDSVPDAIRRAVFPLQMGEVTEPVRQPHGFYIFKAEIVTIRPLSQVRDQIFNQLKQQHAKEWVDRTNAEIKVDFPNPAFPPKGAPSTPVK
ncbi:MAG: peptidylprolyl isomerase [Bryobacteraceae bacterium]